MVQAKEKKKKLPLILASQRVDDIENYGEKRDALDQRWAQLFYQIHCLLLPLPNVPEMVEQLLEQSPFPQGILLTGGNNPVPYGGTAPERDAVDRLLIEYAINYQIPLLGVCRGMQSIITYFGGSLHSINGHRAINHNLLNSNRIVNSYHQLGALQVPNELEIINRSYDGVVEEIQHKHMPIYGIMWHPEREVPFCSVDISLLIKVFL